MSREELAYYLANDKDVENIMHILEEVDKFKGDIRELKLKINTLEHVNMVLTEHYNNLWITTSDYIGFDSTCYVSIPVVLEDYSI